MDAPGRREIYQQRADEDIADEDIAHTKAIINAFKAAHSYSERDERRHLQSWATGAGE